MRLRRLIIAAAAVALAAPAPASAEFHFVSIREVFPGDSSGADAEYVVLQAYAGGQHLVANHSVSFRNSVGAEVGSAKFLADVKDGQNQMTMLVATAAAESRFGVTADAGMEPNLIDPAGGAICWESLDCVAWGSFDSALYGSSLPSPAGAPAAAIADGMALRRTIAPGCPTLLEASDDRDNSALDFEAVFPAPRPNSVAPTEKPCAGGATGGRGGAGAGGDRGQGAASVPPQTRLLRKPAKVTRDRTPTFAFRSNRRGAIFLCRIDRKRFRRCRSPLTLKRLSLGRHVFRVKARAGGRTDPTPAVFRFRVVRR